MKVKVTIVLEADDFGCMGGLAHEVSDALRRENRTGLVEKVDGDKANWKTSYKKV